METMTPAGMVYRQWMSKRLINPKWVKVEARGDGEAFVDMLRTKSVIFSAEMHEGQWWMHLSIARPDRLPTWEEFRDAKEEFIGTDRVAYQVLPPKTEYVNIHPNCLHAFSPVDRAKALPDFTRGTGSL